MQIPYFILNNETHRERDRWEEECHRERERAAEEKKKKKSETTKCNLSAFLDSQRLKRALTVSVEECSLIGQGRS